MGEVRHIGNPGHRSKEQLAAREPIPVGVRPGEVPDEPDWELLAPGTSGRAEDMRSWATTSWHEVVPELAAVGLLEKADLHVLIDYCLTRADIRCLEAQLYREPPVQETRYGMSKHPLYTPLGQARSHMNGLRDSLFLTPKARKAVPTKKAASSEEGANGRPKFGSMANGEGAS